MAFNALYIIIIGNNFIKIFLEKTKLFLKSTVYIAHDKIK